MRGQGRKKEAAVEAPKQISSAASQDADPAKRASASTVPLFRRFLNESVLDPQSKDRPVIEKMLSGAKVYQLSSVDAAAQAKPTASSATAAGGSANDYLEKMTHLLTEANTKMAPRIRIPDGEHTDDELTDPS